MELSTKRYIFGREDEKTMEAYGKSFEGLCNTLAKSEKEVIRPQEKFLYAGTPSRYKEKHGQVLYLFIDYLLHPYNGWNVSDKCWVKNTNGLHYMATVHHIEGQKIFVNLHPIRETIECVASDLFVRNFDAFALFVDNRGNSSIVPIRPQFKDYKNLAEKCEEDGYSFCVPLMPYLTVHKPINYQLLLNLDIYDLERASVGFDSLAISRSTKLSTDISNTNLETLYYLLNGINGDNPFPVGETMKQDDVLGALEEMHSSDYVPEAVHGTIVRGGAYFDSEDVYSGLSEESVVTKTQSGYIGLVTPSAECKTNFGRFGGGDRVYLKPPEYIGKDYCVICQGRGYKDYADHITIHCMLLGRCSNCRQTTHPRKDCPYKDKPVCFWCADIGHKKADCPNGKVCYHCKNSGHEVRECKYWRLKPREAKIQHKVSIYIPPHIFTEQEKKERDSLMYQRVVNYDEQDFYNPYIYY